MATWRKVWTWHLWLGVGLVLPLIWWLGTAIVFIVWPMDVVRGRHLTSVEVAAAAPLPPGLQIPSSLLEGSQSLSVRRVEGHIVAVAGRKSGPQVWDLERGEALGSSLPLGWVEQGARRHFKGPFPLEAIYLYGPDGTGKRMSGTGPDSLPPPAEFAGPFPAYAFHLATGPSAHLYLDALTGEVRQRRTAIWRAYDLAFRLHSLDFASEPVRRTLMALVGLAGLLTTGTGASMAWKRLKRRPA